MENTGAKCYTAWLVVSGYQAVPYSRVECSHVKIMLGQ